MDFYFTPGWGGGNFPVYPSWVFVAGHETNLPEEKKNLTHAQRGFIEIGPGKLPKQATSYFLDKET